MNAVEKRLYEYPGNAAELERIRAEANAISSAHVSKLEPSARGKAKSPVEGWYTRLEKLRRRIAALERETEPVERLLRKLPDGLRELLEEHYFRGVPWRRVWLHRHISRVTVWRKRCRLLEIAGQYLGEGV